MSSANSPPRHSDLVRQDAAQAAADALEDEAAEDDVDNEDDADVTDELSEETGIDLTDASDLDADNVPADEEFDRVMQAPD